MIIERLIEDLGKGMAKMLLNKKDKKEEKIELDNLDSSDTLFIFLKKLVFEGKYNEAEDLLFKEVNKSPSEELYNVGIKFYNLLLEKTDEELMKMNFSREEIYQGMEDLKYEVKR